MKRLYLLGDSINREEHDRLAGLRHPTLMCDVRAERIGEIRVPRNGEWYLCSVSRRARRATGDEGVPRAIVRLVGIDRDGKRWTPDMPDEIQLLNPGFAVHPMGDRGAAAIINPLLCYADDPDRAALEALPVAIGALRQVGWLRTADELQRILDAAWAARGASCTTR